MREHPSHVRVPPAAQNTGEAAAKLMGRMRVALVITALMMPAMACHPKQDRALCCHRAGYAKTGGQRSTALEASMSEKSMKSHGKPERSDYIHRAAEDQIERRNAIAPKMGDRQGEGNEGNDDSDDGYPPLETFHRISRFGAAHFRTPSTGVDASRSH